MASFSGLGLVGCTVGKSDFVYGKFHKQLKNIFIENSQISDIKAIGVSMDSFQEREIQWGCLVS